MIDRLKKIIEMSHLSERAFASRCGLTQNALWYQLNGKRKLSLETIEAIVENFPDVSAEWLLRGNGSMLKGQEDADNERRISNLIDVITMQQETIRNLTEKIKQLQNQ